MNWLQQDCVTHRGVCAGCPHNLLTSQECQVKYTPDVAKRLGLDPKARTLRGSRAKVRHVTCEFCHGAFTTNTLSGKYCPPCREAKPSKNHRARYCGACDLRYWAHMNSYRCPKCKAVAA